MAITLDTAGSVSTDAARGTVTLTIGVGANQALVVNTGAWGGSGQKTVGTVYWNTSGGGSVNLTKAVQLETDTVNTAVWHLLAPTTGAGSVIGVLAESGHIRIGAHSLFGVKQSGQPDAAGSASFSGLANGKTTNLTTVDDQCWIFDAIADQSAAMTKAAGQTLSFDFDSSTTTASYKPDVAVGVNSMAWTWTGNEDGCHSLASYAPAVAAGGARISTLGLMSAG